MGIHVLSGDSLLEQFKSAGITGEVAVFRECFVDGPSVAESLDELFEIRENYLDDHSPGFYSSHVRPEIEKVLNAETGTEIFLWFEHELFCQVNLWFLLHYLKQEVNLYFIGPEVANEDHRFQGWRDHGANELRDRFTGRQSVGMSDRELGAELWKAFSMKESSKLLELGDSESKIFRYLGEVTKAAAQVGSRPESALRRFAEEGMAFGEAFRAFCEKEPVYGFGDLQVKRIWDSVSEG